MQHDECDYCLTTHCLILTDVIMVVVCILHIACMLKHFLFTYVPYVCIYICFDFFHPSPSLCTVDSSTTSRPVYYISLGANCEEAMLTHTPTVCFPLNGGVAQEVSPTQTWLAWVSSYLNMHGVWLWSQ